MLLAKEYVNFLIDNDLTQRQFLFLYLSLYKEDNLLLKYKRKFKINPDLPASKQPFLSKREFDDLINKEFLIKPENNYEIGTKFITAFGAPHVLFSQLMRVYPSYIYVDKKRFPTTVLDIKQISELYFKYIYGSIKKHEEILFYINIAKQRNDLNLKLENFIKSKYWNVLEQEYGSIGLVDNNDDTTEQNYNTIDLKDDDE